MPTPLNYTTLSAAQGKGRYVEVDANGVIPNIAFYRQIIPKTASFTVLRTQSGAVFTTTGATAAVNFTLPAINTGPWWFEFFNGADQSMTVTSGTADTIVTFNDLQADSVAFSTASEKIGGHIIAFTDGTTLFVVAHGSKENQHITIAS